MFVIIYELNNFGHVLGIVRQARVFGLAHKQADTLDYQGSLRVFATGLLRESHSKKYFFDISKHRLSSKKPATSTALFFYNAITNYILITYELSNFYHVLDVVSQTSASGENRTRRGCTLIVLLATYKTINTAYYYGRQEIGNVAYNVIPFYPSF